MAEKAQVEQQITFVKEEYLKRWGVLGLADGWQVGLTRYGPSLSKKNRVDHQKWLCVPTGQKLANGQNGENAASELYMKGCYKGNPNLATEKEARMRAGQVKRILTRNAAFVGLADSAEIRFYFGSIGSA